MQGVLCTKGTKVYYYNFVLSIMIHQVTFLLGCICYGRNKLKNLNFKIVFYFMCDEVFLLCVVDENKVARKLTQIKLGRLISY